MDVATLKKFVNSQKEDLVNFLGELIEIKSLTSHEEQIVNKVKNKMIDMGYDEVFNDAIGNVIGKIGNGPKTIVLDSHLDVVSAEKEKWNSDPFKAEIIDGKIYGRGAMDDKGPFVCALYAGKAIKELMLNNEFTIYIVGSVSEEDCEGLALGAFLEEYNIKPDYVVIAEASNLKICRGHRGRALIEASFIGNPVHASMHEDGTNPIETALSFMKGVEELDRRLSDDGLLGKGDIVVTNVSCESNSLNTLPSICKVIIDRRLNTNDNRESVIAELKSLPNSNKCNIKFIEYIDDSYNGYKKEAQEYFPAWILDDNHELIKAGVKNYLDLFEEKPIVTVWGFSTNGTYTMGKANIPTLGFGPGIEELAHGNNEYIDINDLIKATEFYALLPVSLSKK